MQARAEAVTFEEFKRCQYRGGGPGGRGESALAPIWRHWAGHIIHEKLAGLESMPHTPARYIEEIRLKAQFERVCDNTAAACTAIREHSPLYPYVKYFM